VLIKNWIPRKRMTKMTMTLYKNEELGCDIIIFGEDMDTVILVNGEVRSVEE